MAEILEDIDKAYRSRVKRVRQPTFCEPMRATLVHDYFSRSGWIFERKLDGERCLFHKKGDHVILYSRNRKKMNRQYPEIVEAIEKLPENFIMDGELVTFEGRVTSFKRLQKRMHVENPDSELLQSVPVYAYVFDILYYGGYNLCKLPLKERKKLLRRLFSPVDHLRLLPYRKEKGEAFLKQACAKGWEGLIAKDADSQYEHKRSKSWLKFKCGNRQELVVGGYTEPEGERVGLGALLLGYFKEGDLIYAGKVGTGFSRSVLRDLRRQLDRIERKTSPFADCSQGGTSVHWTTPKLVAEIGFTEWTRDGQLRHPRFLGLRDDKKPESVVREARQ